MNILIAIVKPEALPVADALCAELALPMSIDFRARGTAVQSMLDLLGIESTERRMVLAVGCAEKISQLIGLLRRRLYLGVPGHGIAVACPIKAIGGGKTMEYLNGSKQPEKKTPGINYAYELLIAIANEGRTDMVMNAARAVGAAGGTVLHGKGTGSRETEKFLNVSIAEEKEVILIVSPADRKADIMRAIVQKAGPGSEAGAIVFSLPVSEVAGFGLFEE